MNTESKIDAILNAWLKFIRLEDFSSASQPSAQAEHQSIKLASNNLFIEEKVFSRIRDSSTSRQQGKFETTWVASFPQIYKVEDGKQIFYPLFSIDITPIFKGNYQAQGWNIEGFEMAAVAARTSSL